MGNKSSNSVHALSASIKLNAAVVCAIDLRGVGLSKEQALHLIDKYWDAESTNQRPMGWIRLTEAQADIELRKF